MFSKVIKCLEPIIRKQMNFKRLLNTKQMNRLQNILIEICKCKYNQVKLVLAVFVFACLYQVQGTNYIEHDAISKSLKQRVNLS